MNQEMGGQRATVVVEMVSSMLDGYVRARPHTLCARLIELQYTQGMIEITNGDT